MMRASLPRATAVSRITTLPMRNTMAVVSNGGMAPVRAVRLANVAHKRMAPTPSSVAAFDDGTVPRPPICHVAPGALAAVFLPHATRQRRLAQDRARPAQSGCGRSRGQLGQGA